MWSTSPAERTVIVPPRSAPDDPAPPHAAATPATSTATATTDVLRTDIAPPWVERSCGSGVEGVADPVSEQVEGEHGEQEGEPGENEEPPGGGEDRRRLGEHRAPARLGWVDA